MTTPSLRERLASGPAVLAPGVYDAMTALIAEQMGFDALYLSGGAVAYTQLGRSDVGLTTATETADVLARITDRVSLPVIVDGDTGYGNALNTQRTVRDFERAGAAMIQLEDQTFPKRCGHLENKTLVSTQEMCGKLRAALDARHSSDTLILARTDAVAVEGLDAALERADAYLACGVDALFIEAVVSAADMDRVCGKYAATVPLLANMVEGGKTPVGSVDELSARGYKIVIYPGGTARFVSRQLQRYYSSLKTHGTTQPLWGEMNDFNELNQLIGTPELLEQGRKYSA
ncbi:isocitrate lyase/PEP mutase family protein [Bordetella sp. 02P26C-1]|uniref:isocitrate lyase/PEP mutase family protein n=1 Tax=Bordetella sp. 02P26C-1 TaxID=2683195 RepID=UPI0013540D80|nr:isocitrate lyase/phosphoenolpyruvate mutase family protein [Bordetella sp. 02P26C-1]MVW77569.1 carboxyvinyl-carboxyphosphonate phosphorylmutase [Bordetella sp. 02P26C-1]